MDLEQPPLVNNINIRFYDNEMSNWDKDMIEHSRQIEFINVDNITRNNFITNVQINGKLTKDNTNATLNQAYIDYFVSQGNQYAHFLKRITESGNNAEIEKVLKKDYPNNGISPNVQELMDWSNEQDGSTKYAIFDWDKTITVVEGMYFGDYQGENIQNIDPLQIALFIMGGQDRLNLIQQAIEELKKNNIQIFIITHNPNATKWNRISRGVYLNLINIIFNFPYDFIDGNVLYCSKDYGFKKWKASCGIPELFSLLNCQQKTDNVQSGKTKSTSRGKLVNTTNPYGGFKSRKLIKRKQITRKNKHNKKNNNKKHNKTKNRKHKTYKR